jgi:hypothetical protein
MLVHRAVRVVPVLTLLYVDSSIFVLSVCLLWTWGGVDWLPGLLLWRTRTPSAFCWLCVLFCGRSSFYQILFDGSHSRSVLPRWTWNFLLYACNVCVRGLWCEAVFCLPVCLLPQYTEFCVNFLNPFVCFIVVFVFYNALHFVNTAPISELFPILCKCFWYLKECRKSWREDITWILKK